MNLSWVTDHLAVGGRIHPEDIHALRLEGVTHVIDTRSEHADDKVALGNEHIELLYLPAPDAYPLSVEQLMQGAVWANEKIREGGRVLIHCEHGVGGNLSLWLKICGWHDRKSTESSNLAFHQSSQSSSHLHSSFHHL